MRELAPFRPVGPKDPTEDRRLLPKDCISHPGKMRFFISEDVLRTYPAAAIADPLIGVGTLVIQAAKFKRTIYGCDGKSSWAQATEELRQLLKVPGWVICGDSSKIIPLYSVKLVFTSPPFPNSHTAGNSEMQDNLRADKDAYAGTEYDLGDEWGCGTSPRKDLWQQKLAEILWAWTRGLERRGHVAVHVKNYIRDNKIIPVDEWVEEVFSALKLQTLGFHRVPLEFNSLMKNMGRYPKRKIVGGCSTTVIGTPSDLEVILECGHRKVYKKVPKQTPDRSVCVECGPIPDRVQVDDERVVVAVKP